MKYFDGKRICITGGTGSWGNELTKQLLGHSKVEEIVIYSRNEFNQVQMERKFRSNKIKFVIGDVRDIDQLTKTFADIDIVFHLAALKHVPICEKYPYEAIKTNIQGTENVIKAAIKNCVSKVIDVSTDKAANPLNLYGQTKAVGEKLILLANQDNNVTKFSCIRGGNVLGSNGSVVPYFIDLIKNNKPLTITHPEMTRYFMSLPEAISLLFEAASSPETGMFVMKMPSCHIIDLAKALIKKYGNRYKHGFNISGIRQGEKIHELLVTPYEAEYCYEWGTNYYMISQNPVIGRKKVSFNEYASNSQPLMNEEQIIQMLEKGGF